MADLATFDPRKGLERVWVPGGEEDEWIARFGRMGIAAARWRDYIRWGREFYPPTEQEPVIRRKVMLPSRPRKRTNYARWRGY